MKRTRTALGVALLLALVSQLTAHSSDDLVYGYECRSGFCQKVELSEENYAKAISLPVCRLFCGSSIGTLWPKPTGTVRLDTLMRQVDISFIDFNVNGTARQQKLWRAAEDRFMDMLNAQIPDRKVLARGGYRLSVNINTPDEPTPARLTLETDESYALDIDTDASGHVLANITAANFFGARHGLETLAQLIVYDDIRREVQVTANATITDAPVYKWRGLLLDTSRNYYSVKSIKRTLEGMALVKLNTFHWHITDSHSFPLEVKKRPELHKLGAYSQRQVYTRRDVAEVVEYGRVRGIRVMPEFDAPAHVGEGWQHKNMTACFNAQPWKSFCVEPPCGQLDPTVNEMYDVLEDIYGTMFDQFNPDVFHMGGDEVSTSCWNSSRPIQKWMKKQKWGLETADFMRLWGHFQTEALGRVDKVANGTHTPIILWTSGLTEEPFIDEYLNPERYIIQIWTTGADPKVKKILERGYKIIVSNYDALYLDCGGAGWVTDGNNWCSPYIGWQKVYDNSLKSIAGDYEHHVLGAEGAIWSEQIDEHTLDNRFWPRASALAERLWSNPGEGWRQAESRLLLHRQRLVDNGLGAEAMQPQWCLQNEHECPIDAYDAQV
ncbi:chitooligosaccharidolytic beta-N-acetylglucosaminidase isoform X1 [Drosophila teissieri]|uniref:chitooligosaccharidolytic beta-N-acetylglucosaminidase isoform X1 n=1 Tax=Drosophila teissieri TaxID=7243 RepID=UPI001CB9DC69|nr:chitooligosaccharidolytic beta-N-acetylglucosaminidase isoform X1 [Drosophila teissieri]XP_043650720.1 chitooligosaccharidolytic beta-N-acetylglucosaminidase isoform X1 [Drosophila teissieri]